MKEVSANILEKKKHRGIIMVLFLNHSIDKDTTELCITTNRIHGNGFKMSLTKKYKSRLIEILASGFIANSASILLKCKDNCYEVTIKTTVGGNIDECDLSSVTTEMDVNVGDVASISLNANECKQLIMLLED